MKHLFIILINLFVLVHFSGTPHASAWSQFLPAIAANGMKYQALSLLHGEWVFRIQEGQEDRFSFHECSISQRTNESGERVLSISTPYGCNGMTTENYFAFELAPGLFEIFMYYEKYIFTIQAPGEVAGCAYLYGDWETCHDFTGSR